MRHTTPLLLLLVFLSAPAVAKPDKRPLAERVDEVVRPYVDSGILIGAVVGVIDGESEVVRGFGRLSAVRAEAPDAETIFEIGSISKVFTGVMLASLAGEGLVELDDSVQALLPKGPLVPTRASDDGKQEITLTHLATHSSGLPYMPGNFNPPDKEHPYVHYTTEAMYAFLSAHMLRRAPGEQYEYSNLGAGLLGHALELRSKHTYAALLRSRITRPLGLTATHIDVPAAGRANLAPPHTADGVPTEPWDFAVLKGAGAVRSNVKDMLVFARANLEAGDSPLGRALTLARKIHWRPTVGRGPSMGLGWHAGPGDLRWHNGQTGGFHSFLQVEPAKGRALVILSNTASDQVDQLGQALANMLAGKPVEAPAFQMPIELAGETLNRYVGTYEILPQFKLTVTHEDGRLMAQATGQGKIRLWPKSETEFFLRVVTARVTFEKDNDGKIVALTLFQNGQELKGKREK